MGSTQSKKNQRAQTITGLVLATAAVGYGMKKLYDYWTSEEGTSSESRHTRSRHRQSKSRRFITNDDESGIETDGDSHEYDISPIRRASLLKRLRYYDWNYVEIPYSEMRPAVDVVQDITDRFSKYVERNYPEFMIRSCEQTGAAHEGLQVRRPGNFEIMMPLVLEEHMWELVPGDDMLQSAPGYFMVRRVNLDFFEKGKSKWDQYMTNTYLDPGSIKRKLRSILERIINWNQKYQVYLKAVGTIFKLHVEYDIHTELLRNTHREIEIDFLPAIILGDTCILAKPHPLVKEEDGYQLLWQQSFSTNEQDFIKGIDDTTLPTLENSYYVYPEEHGDTANDRLFWETNPPNCQKQCLKIILAICQSHAPLKWMSFCQLKTVLFHMIDRPESRSAYWHKDNLAKCILDFLVMLKDFIYNGCLPYKFSSKMNLFQGIGGDILVQSGEYLDSLLELNEQQMADKLFKKYC